MKIWFTKKSPDARSAYTKPRTSADVVTPVSTPRRSSFRFSFSSPSSSLSNPSPESKSSRVLQDFFKDVNFSPGPKVKPYAFSQTTQPVRFKLPESGERKCFVCDEDISVSFSNEKSVSLKCGDSVHGECFAVLIRSGDYSKVPLCCGTNCQKALEDGKSAKQMIPVDEEVMRSAMVATAKIDSSRKYQTQKRSSTQSSSDPLRSSRSSMNKRPMSSTGSGLGDVYSRIVRESSPAPTESSHRTITVRVENNKEIPSETLSNRFIKYLVEHNRNFSLSSILNCGKLRLVDTLFGTSVEKEGESPSNFTVAYLFQHSLLIWYKTMNLTIILSLAEAKFKILSKDSILKVESRDQNGIFHELWLASENPSILEKWVIALSDYTFEFPSELMTSTLDKLDEITSDLLSPIATHFQISQKLESISGRDVIHEEYEDEEEMRYTPAQPLSLLPMDEYTLKTATISRSSIYSDVDPLSLTKRMSATMQNFNSSKKSNLKVNQPRLAQSLCEESHPDSDADSDSDSNYDSDEDKIQSYLNLHNKGKSIICESQASFPSPSISVIDTFEEELRIITQVPQPIEPKMVKSELISDSISNVSSNTNSDSEIESEIDSDEEIISKYKRLSQKMPSGWSDLLVRLDSAIVNSI
ncbi:hypothetical protein CLIB1423_03S06084 [[Candida] railenensis]|uniref:PH domain-containing protein n=1 Tax=[Candida] railenensis TaxID=45579 RepID=A0A9P0QMS9_9ASCO|nr:hypothetical protein CLIB1423_03S06084 [[Candida] railenensis]